MKCKTCKVLLDQPAKPWTLDCGGDCRRCMAEAGDPDRMKAEGMQDPWDLDKLPEPSPRKRRERTAQRRALKYARDNGWVAGKVKIVGQTGFPDTLCVKSGRKTLWWEFKKKGETPDDHQQERMNQLRGDGTIVGWSDNFELFKHALDNMT
jgi:hypothetical protein